MPLTAESQAVLNILAEQGVKALDALAPSEGRKYFNTLFETRPEDRPPCARVEDLEIPVSDGHIRARLYAPEADRALPLMVHFHGGGWVYFDLETHDGYCRTLVDAADCAVLAVEYRKAPEFRFPVAVEDCYAALAWAAAHAATLGCDDTRLGVIGDSAGGNLAAVVAMLARDRGGPRLRAQVLSYPALDATLNQPSIAENAEAPLLGKAQMDWFYGHYLEAGTAATDPRLSPLLAPQHAGLPPAFIATAEYDPLRDEGEAYAGKLQAAGVDIACQRYNGVFHGFMLMHKVIPEGAELIARQAAFIRSHLS